MAPSHSLKCVQIKSKQSEISPLNHSRGIYPIPYCPSPVNTTFLMSTCLKLGSMTPNQNSEIGQALLRTNCDLFACYTTDCSTAA